MKDFDKNRVGFTVALFAASFSLYPIMKDMKNDFITRFTPNFLTINGAFWLFNFLLGLSIYLYALSFTGGESNLKRTKVIGDWCYKIAIYLPLLYLLSGIVYFMSNYERTYEVYYFEWLPVNDQAYKRIVTIFYVFVLTFLAIPCIDLVEGWIKKKKRDSTKDM